MNNDLEQLIKMEAASKKFFKKCVNDATPIKLTTFVKVMEIFSNMEKGFENLIKEKSDKVTNEK